MWLMLIAYGITTLIAVVVGVVIGLVLRKKYPEIHTGVA